MAGQNTFNGALGWDDWIWWTAITGVGLFLLLLIICCVCCVQRAKRKGRQEALASVQARERERQQREEAQLRYAQAQQQRYPPNQQPSFQYSKQTSMPYVPPGSKAPYGPQVAANGYQNAVQASPPPAHQAPPPVMYNQQQPQQQMYQQQQSKKEQQLYPPQQQTYNHQQLKQHQEQNQMYAQPQKQASYQPSPQQQMYQQAPPSPPPKRPAKAYQPPARWYNATTNGANDKIGDAPAPIGASAAFDASTSSAYPASMAYSTFENDGLHDGPPFVAVTSPSSSSKKGDSVRGSNASTAKTVGNTLRDRIDALREGSIDDQHTRISVDPLESSASSNFSIAPSRYPTNLEASSSVPAGGRRSAVMAGTVLSTSSVESDSPPVNAYPLHDDQLDMDAESFDTARSLDEQLERKIKERHRFDSDLESIGSDFSSGQFEDAVDSRETRKDDNNSFNSRGSVEF